MVPRGGIEPPTRGFSVEDTPGFCADKLKKLKRFIFVLPRFSRHPNLSRTYLRVTLPKLIPKFPAHGQKRPIRSTSYGNRTRPELPEPDPNIVNQISILPNLIPNVTGDRPKRPRNWPSENLPGPSRRRCSRAARSGAIWGGEGAGTPGRKSPERWTIWRTPAAARDRPGYPSPGSAPGALQIIVQHGSASSRRVILRIFFWDRERRDHRDRKNLCN